MRQEETPSTARRTALRLGGACAVAGSVAVAGFRLNHGDLPAADAHAALGFISAHPFYAGVHIGAILGVLTWTAGFVTLASTLTHPLGRVLGRMGAAGVLAGAAIYGTEHSIDGVTGQSLAGMWAGAAPAGQANLDLAAHTAFQMLRGPSLIAIILLWGLAPMLYGRALTLEGHPVWLGRVGLVIGATTVVSSVALLMREDLFPGFLVYGLLVSIVVQLWSLFVGVSMWRRSRGTASAGLSPAPVRDGEPVS
ncbi:hypothetical protein AB0D67_24185 [Streptosporangium sp. NPDC048047]|uniref:hypothetical protein n=1 Tax=Streptosporangium sp. NPDC048047 TaxID=3155748 RepID=UPI00341F1695